VIERSEREEKTLKNGEILRLGRKSKEEEKTSRLNLTFTALNGGK